MKEILLNYRGFNSPLVVLKLKKVIHKEKPDYIKIQLQADYDENVKDVKLFIKMTDNKYNIEVKDDALILTIHKKQG